MTRGPRTHGSHSKREIGSIGANSTPSRVFPGKRMAGHMGAKRRKTKALKVLLMFFKN